MKTEMCSQAMEHRKAERRKENGVVKVLPDSSEEPALQAHCFLTFSFWKNETTGL